MHTSRLRLWAALTCLLLAGGRPLAADVSGRVRDATTLAGIAGAHVQLRAATSGVTTDANGDFTLPVTQVGTVQLAASVTYQRGAAVNYLIGGTFANNGNTGVTIDLRRLPTAENATYVPVSAGECGGCHRSGYPQWGTSNHADAATNPWVLDLYSGTGTGTASGASGYVFRSSHPGQTGFCATCHAPMAEVRSPGQVFLDEVTEGGAREGVNCVTCHQMDSVDAGNLNALHLLGKATYRFPQGSGATSSYVWGPLRDVTYSGMRVSRSALHESSLLCASCHQYNRPGNNVDGQHTYSEWQASPFAVPGPGYRTCQDCHMPPAAGVDPLCIFVAEDRPAAQRRQHTFVGSTPATLQANLGLAASASQLYPDRIRVRAEVSNFGAGHSFPTGISIRNALLLVTARHDGQELVQVSGPTIPFWGSDDVPGEQPGDYAGHPGKGFAKILEGRINGQGPVVRPVLFIDAESVFSNTLIPSGAVDQTTIEFALPPGAPSGSVVEIETRLLYRRAFRALQVTKGWTQSAHGGPAEIEVATQQLSLVLQGAPATQEIPALGSLGVAALALVLAAAGILLARRG